MGIEMKKNVLVTGGAGYIGSCTVNRLLKRGDKVTVYDNFLSSNQLPADKLDFIRGDIGDYELLRKVLIDKNIDVVHHLAALTSVGESVLFPQEYYLNNVIKGKYLLDALLDSNVKKIIFSSSCATYGMPLNTPVCEEEKQFPVSPYGWTKLIFEQMLRDYDFAYGLKHIILRYFNVAGAGAEASGTCKSGYHIVPLLLDAASRGKHFSIFGNDHNTYDGTCIRDYVHVLDAADAGIKSIDYIVKDNKSDVFNIGSGRGTSVFEVIKAVECVTEKKINIKISKRRVGDPSTLIADNTKAKETLGWTPSNSSIHNIVETMSKKYY